MFLIELSYTAPLEQVDALLAAHVAYLDDAYAAGHFVLSGRKEPRTGGIILATMPSRDALDALLARDPFYQAGVAQYRVVEFVASRSDPSIASLLGR